MCGGTENLSLCVVTRRVINKKGKRVANNNTLCVLHLNIQSISNKQTELDLVLKSDLRNIDVLCFKVHWIKLQVSK